MSSVDSALCFKLQTQAADQQAKQARQAKQQRPAAKRAKSVTFSFASRINPEPLARGEAKTPHFIATTISPLPLQQHTAAAMPPSRQQSPSLASDSANATPRARITRSARSRDSLASVASAPTPSKRPILNPEATPSARSRIPSDRFADRSNTPVRPTSSSLKASATPSSVRHRPSKLSHSLASASSPLKLRKRTDTQPTKMPQISSAKSVSSLSRLAVAESMRQKQSSELDEITKYSESEPIQVSRRPAPRRR